MTNTRIWQGSSRQMMDTPIDTGTLYYLRTFYVVAAERSFTRAARQLGISQPAVSAHIRALERHYGTALFEVRHRRVYLTPAGETLREHSERIFNLVYAAGRAVNAVARLESGYVTVAASHSIATYVLPRRLASFATRFPGMRVTVLAGTSAATAAHVLAERAPVGFVEAPVSHPRLDVEPFADDELVLVVPPDHPWAAMSTVAPEDVRGTVLLQREADAGARALVEAALTRAGIATTVHMEFSSPEALKQAIMAGLGVGWVPQIAIEREVEAGLLCPVLVTGVRIQRHFFCVSPLDTTAHPAVQAVIDLLVSGE